MRLHPRFANAFPSPNPRHRQRLSSSEDILALIREWATGEIHAKKFRYQPLSASWR